MTDILHLKDDNGKTKKEALFLRTLLTGYYQYHIFF